MLGVCVVLVGMCVAVAGYVSAAPKQPVGVGGRGSTHVERMKLAGPIVMGIGLFIFICSATLLYENRDREKKKQAAFDDLEGLKTGMSWEESCQEFLEGGKGATEQATTWAAPVHVLPLSQHHWAPSPAPPPPRNHVQGGGLSRPVTPFDLREDTDVKRGVEKGSTLLACVLYHQEPRALTPPSPCPSVTRSSICSDSCNSMEVNFNTRTASPLPTEL